MRNLIGVAVGHSTSRERITEPPNAQSRRIKQNEWEVR